MMLSKIAVKKMVLLSAAVFLTAGCQQRYIFKETRLMMGTFVEVSSPYKEAGEIVFREIKKAEKLLSRYIPDSDISRLNTLGKLEVAPETLAVLKKAKEFYRITNGAFDVTVGPLLDLWGFTDGKYREPQKEEVTEVLRLVGSDKILIDKNTVELAEPGMEVDLGAIAKGYAVDLAMQRLREKGIDSALINAGGDIFCLGNKGGSPWKVAIRDPGKKGFIEYLDLEDKAVATSGDYEQYFKGERIFTHIFDPRSGFPVSNGIVSATVVADDCLTADAVATIVFVEGKEAVDRLRQMFDVEIKIITEKDVYSYRKTDNSSLCKAD